MTRQRPEDGPPEDKSYRGAQLPSNQGGPREDAMQETIGPGPPASPAETASLAETLPPTTGKPTDGKPAQHGNSLTDNPWMGRDTADSQADATVDFSVEEGATQNFTPGGRTDSGDPRARMPRDVGGFQIIKILGRGGMGVVYKAHQKKLGRDVALKMVLAGAHASAEQLLRFTSEARAVAHLQHPNIVQIFEVGEHDGLPFFCLEYVEGESLDKQLASKPLPADEAARTMETLCRAMQYAHDHGVLHRDLKPANVLFGSDGTPKVTDFGLAKRLEDVDDSSSTRTGTIMGTPSYMSPEQASGRVHELGPATDQYSLGAMLYEFMIGRPPFLAAKAFETIMQVIREEPIPPRQIQSRLPVDLETICLKALQKEPDKRYASCAAMADDLARFLRGEPIAARPVGNTERIWRWCRRNPLVASLSAAAVAGLLAVALVSSWSALALNAKNKELAQSNTATETANANLKTSNLELEQTNQSLAESNTENIRRTERLQEYVQYAFKELNKLSVVENPLARDYKNEALKQTLPLIEEIIRELPDGGQGEATKMSLLHQLAMSYRDQGKGAEADQWMSSLADKARERIEIQAGSDAARNNLCIILMDLSSIRRELNRDVPASLAALRDALGIAEQIVAAPTAAPDGFGMLAGYRAKMLLADANNNLAAALYRAGDSAAAAPYFDQSLKLRREVLATVADGTAFENLPPSKVPLTENDKARLGPLVESTISTGILAQAAVLSRIGQQAKAEEVFRQAVGLSEKQLTAAPENPLVIRRMAGFDGFLGEFLCQTDRIEEGLRYLQRAAELSDKLRQSNTNSAELNRAAATAYYRYAQWLAENHSDESVVWGNKALEIRQSMATAESSNDRRQLELMLVLARFGEVEAAEKIADKYLALENRDSEMLIELAQSLAQCSARASGDAQSQLQDKALTALESAIDLGFRDKAFIEADVDLRPLRGLPKLSTILAKLAYALNLNFAVLLS